VEDTTSKRRKGDDMDKIVKGQRIQVRTSPRVYLVTMDENDRGQIHCSRQGRTFIFRRQEDEVRVWNGVEEKVDSNP